MWPNAAIGQRYLVSIMGTLMGQQIINTFRYRISTVSDVMTIEDAMDQLHEQLVANTFFAKFLLCCPINYTLDEAWVQCYHPGRYIKGVYAHGTPGNSGTANVPNTAAVITRRGVGATRKNIGSVHIPLPDVATHVVNGVVTAAHLLGLETFAGLMRTPVTGQGAVFASFIPILDNGPNANDVTDVTIAFPQETSRVMRRRTLRVGV